MPRDKRVGCNRAAGVLLSGSGLSRFFVGKHDAGSGFAVYRCWRMSIFDSVVSDFKRHTRRVKSEMKRKSANIELCVICRSFFEKRNLIGQTLRSRRTDAGRQRSDGEAGNESQITQRHSWRWFQTLGECGPGSTMPATGAHSFLTESLILAQNERWRRG